MLGASMSVSANSNQTDNVVSVPEIEVAEATQVEESANNAVRLKFMSRRGYRNPAVNNKDQYKAENTLNGATNIEQRESERESKASKRLNRQFRSKRSHINYQFN